MKAVLKESFELQQFPFDSQNLLVQLQQDNSRNWDNFDLTVCMVLLHLYLTELPEVMREVTLKRLSRQMVSMKDIQRT